MKGRRLSTRPSPTRKEASLKRLAKEFPTESDLILLCSFREHLYGERTFHQLRDSLLVEGFRAPLARYLIRSSGILHRASKNRYRLRCSPASVGNQPDTAPLPPPDIVAP